MLVREIIGENSLYGVILYVWFELILRQLESPRGLNLPAEHPISFPFSRDWVP